MRRPTSFWLSGSVSYLIVLCAASVAAPPVVEPELRHRGGVDSDIQRVALPIVHVRNISATDLVPFPAGPATRTVVNRQGSEGGVAGEPSLVYNNVGEPQAYPLTPGVLVADDIRTRCAGSDMTSFEIKVAGPAGGMLNYAFYNGCPSAGGQPYPGLQFQATLPSTGVHILVADFSSSPVSIPGSFWFGMQSLTDGITWAFGGATDVGISEERFDADFGCNTSFGGCPPAGPACANGYLVVYGINCTEVFLAYRADILSAFFTPLALNEQFADDILPITSPDTCDLAQYRADLAGLDGPYTMTFQIFTDDEVNERPLAPVMGTLGTCSGVGNGIVDECFFEFNPVIPVPTAKFWLFYDVDGNQAGPALVGDHPQIGMSEDCFSIFGQPTADVWSQCVWWFGGCPPVGTAPCGTFQNRFYCAGTEPTVACCDLAVSVENPCADEVAITQCFGRFFANTSCAEAPFEPPCGMASCCTLDETCENMFKNDCDAIGGLWQPGRFCGVGNQFCPPAACITAPNDCDQATFNNGGCNDYLCCDLICDIDNFCCIAAWDDTCVNLADQFCPLPPPDECEIAAEGACNSTVILDNTFATDRLTDPGFGCHNGGSGQNGIGSVWAKFTAIATSARLRTCDSPPPADDSLVAIYRGECGSLVEIGCSDDVNGCAATDYNSDFCIAGLIPGNTYYVQLAAWTQADRGRYELEIDCPATCLPPPNDACGQAINIGNGIQAYSTAGATTDGPELPSNCNEGDGLMFNADIWYNYTAPETGMATADLCTGTGFDSRIAVYQGCGCPATTGNTIACNDDFCALNGASRATFNIVQGQCYKIRIGGQGISTGTGLLVMSSVGTGTGPNCPGGTATFSNPMNNTVDARQPNPVNNLMPRQGIQTLTVTAPSGADPECFTLCETAVLGNPNSITSVQASGNTYTLQLARPITPGAVTRIAYNPEFGPGSVGTFISHPANVNGDTTAAPTDILAIIDCLNNVNQMVNCPWGNYSRDIDHSGQFGAPDILRVIDLLNGADVFDVWNGTPRPSATCTPPSP